MGKKTIITRKEDNVITNIIDSYNVVEGSFLAKDGSFEYIVGYIDECEVFEDVEMIDLVKIQEYKYTASGGFVKNPNYVPYISIEEQLAQQQADIQTLSDALAEIILG